MEMEVLTWSNISFDHWLLHIHEIVTVLCPALPLSPKRITRGPFSLPFGTRGEQGPNYGRTKFQLFELQVGFEETISFSFKLLENCIYATWDTLHDAAERRIMPGPRMPLLILNVSPIFLSNLFTLKLSIIQKGSARYCIWLVSRQIRSYKEVTKHVITVVRWHKSGQVKGRELGIAKYCSVVPYIGVLESNKDISTDSTCFQNDIGRLQRDLCCIFWDIAFGHIQ